MPKQIQTFIPVFAPGTVAINSNLAYQKENGTVYYFNGHSMMGSFPNP